jgi:hypothetical protein
LGAASNLTGKVNDYAGIPGIPTASNYASRGLHAIGRGIDYVGQYAVDKAKSIQDSNKPDDVQKDDLAMQEEKDEKEQKEKKEGKEGKEETNPWYSWLFT